MKIFWQKLVQINRFWLILALFWDLLVFIFFRATFFKIEIFQYHVRTPPARARFLAVKATLPKFLNFTCVFWPKTCLFRPFWVFLWCLQSRFSGDFLTSIFLKTDQSGCFLVLNGAVDQLKQSLSFWPCYVIGGIPPMWRAPLCVTGAPLCVTGQKQPKNFVCRKITNLLRIYFVDWKLGFSKCFYWVFNLIPRWELHRIFCE